MRIGSHWLRATSRESALEAESKRMRYKDSQLPIAERVSDLLGRMTLAEKIAQMHSHWLILSTDGNHRLRTDTFAQAATTDDLKAKIKLG
jgi:beta-glucosidase